MATLGGTNLGWADVAQRIDDNGKVQTIIEILAEFKPLISDMVAVECNSGMYHKTTLRANIPTPTWRKLYKGVPSTKSATQQVTDACGMLEMRPYIDVDVLDKAKDKAGVRLSESIAHFEGMAQEIASTTYYGDTDTDPEKFMGLAPRFNEYTRATPDMTKIDYNVITAGGSGSDNTSIWYITHGNLTTSYIYPQGSPAGMTHMDKGVQRIEDSDGNAFDAYEDKYKWDVGLTVRDWRASGRICNIDVSALETESSAADLVKNMIILQERLRGTSLGTGVWYMHPRVATRLRIQMLGADSANTDFNVQLTQDNIEGKPVMMFGGVPIHKDDSILLTEAAVTQAS